MRSLLLLLPLCVPALAGPPIIISDGSVCLKDEVAEFPKTATHQHERAFKAAKFVFQTSAKGCDTAAPCTGPACKTFKDIVVEYRDGGTARQLLVVSDGTNLRITSVSLSFDQWAPAQAGSHHQVRRANGKIQRILVDGRPTVCPSGQSCRLSLHDDTTQQ